MKRFIISFVAVLFVLTNLLVYAGEGGEKGASSKAYEHASENAVFNRVSDWFATLGKSKEEKAKMLEERKAERAAKRAEKEAKKLKKKAEEEAEEAKEEAEEKAEKVKEKVSKQKGPGKGKWK